MNRKIPSTTALAIFESAARHGKFSSAANELHLTESAVSRQISSLENYLGVKLFSRTKKQVILNDAGRAYLSNISKSLSEIEFHTRAMMTHKGQGGVLELAVIPTFASRWLMPLLHDFHARHPEIHLNLTERPDPFLFHGTIFDAALHFNHPSWTDVTRIDLFEEELVPILSPRYFDVSKLVDPASLLSVPLLSKATRENAWADWFELAGCAGASLNEGMRLGLYEMVIEAARAGLGAGLVPRFYVQHELMRYDLVVPFDLPLKHQKHYCLVYPDYKKDSPVVQAFRDWVVEASTNSSPAQLRPGQIHRARDDHPDIYRQPIISEIVSG